MARSGPQRQQPSGPEHQQPSRFFIPRSHRLFAVFDDMFTAEVALSALPGGAELRAGTWIFTGPGGAGELDPGEVAGVARLLSWWFSHNVEHLRGLATLAHQGSVVVAVPARRVAAADAMARVLRQHGGRWFSYTAHGNFVPVSP